MEWWDSVILEDNLDTIKDGKIAIKEDVINTLVEHPTQMRCPSKQLIISCGLLLRADPSLHGAVDILTQQRFNMYESKQAYSINVPKNIKKIFNS